jgi:hypothetical protein
VSGEKCGLCFGKDNLNTICEDCCNECKAATALEYGPKTPTGWKPWCYSSNETETACIGMEREWSPGCGPCPYREAVSQ